MIIDILIVAAIQNVIRYITNFKKYTQIKKLLLF